MRVIFTKSLVHETLFNTVVYGSSETHIIMHCWKRKMGINWNFGNKLFWFTSSDSCHKKMLWKSLNIPLISCFWSVTTYCDTDYQLHKTFNLLFLVSNSQKYYFIQIPATGNLETHKGVNQKTDVVLQHINGFCCLDDLTSWNSPWFVRVILNNCFWSRRNKLKFNEGLGMCKICFGLMGVIRG